MTLGEDRRAHWDATFERRGPQGGSWFELSPRMSLEMIDALGVGRDDAIVDVGGGASGLAGALALRGFTDLTVVDVSELALRLAQQAIDVGFQQIDWVRADMLEWEPARSFHLWHDRAAFHFLTDARSRERYIASAAFAVREGGHLVIGTFAEDGPTFLLWPARGALRRRRHLGSVRESVLFGRGAPGRAPHHQRGGADLHVGIPAPEPVSRPGQPPSFLSDSTRRRTRVL